MINIIRLDEIDLKSETEDSKWNKTRISKFRNRNHQIKIREIL